MSKLYDASRARILSLEAPRLPKASSARYIQNTVEFGPKGSGFENVPTLHLEMCVIEQKGVFMQSKLLWIGFCYKIIARMLETKVLGNPSASHEARTVLKMTESISACFSDLSLIQNIKTDEFREVAMTTAGETLKQHISEGKSEKEK